MAMFMDEAELWKCPKHPSRRRKSGICPKCLRERLVTLCPECASALPCASCPPPVDSSTSSSSSSSSSSFSLFAFSRGGSRRDFANGEPGRLSNQLEIDPSLRRSRSVAVSFLRSRSKYVRGGVGGGGCDGEVVTENENNMNNIPLPKVSRSKINFWSAFTVNKSKKCEVHGNGMEEDSNKSDDRDPTTTNDYTMMMRSRSVAVGNGNGLGPAASASKRKGWYFPSPINAFRHSKTSKSVPVA